MPARSHPCRWAIRSASRPCRWRRRSAQSPTAARSTNRASCAPPSRTASASKCRTRPCAGPSQSGPASQMTAIMEAVVEGGTGKARADRRLHGRRQDRHRSQGRQRARTRRRSTTRRLSGSCRRGKPALAVVVVIDSPHGKGYFGGAVAAPIFKRVAEASLRHLGIAPTVNARAAGAGLGGAPATVNQAGPKSRRSTSSVTLEQARAGLMPDLRGLERARCESRPDAHRHDRPPRPATASSLEQSPAAGSALVRGNTCLLTLGRQPLVRSGATAMTLGDLLSAVAGRAPFDVGATPAQADRAAATVASVTSDSREVVRGSVFVALRGLKADGAAFARDAIARGAIAVVSEAAAPADASVPWLQVSDARLALAALAAEFFGNPSSELVLVGITGTNGKTTTSYVLASIFEAAGIRCGRIGTVGYQIGDREVEATRTTPEAPDAAAAAARNGRAGLRRLRHGGVVARACAPSRRLSALQRRDLHEPDPRSPRLPPRHGGVLPRQAAALRAAAAGRSRGYQSRRPARRGVRGRRAASGHLRDRRACRSCARAR